jgi:iron complex outermembrane receptor protein
MRLVRQLAAVAYCMALFNALFAATQARAETPANLPGAHSSSTSGPEQAVVGLREIAVGQRRPSTSTLQRVDTATLDRQDARSVAELVRLIPGAHLPVNSRGEGLIHLRDAGERQVAVFLDGAQLMVPWDYAIDVGLVPAAMIGHVTVAKGASSVLLGTNVAGGAINLETRRLEGPGVLTEAQAQGGLPGAGRLALTHLRDTGGWTWAGSAAFDRRGNVALPADGHQVGAARFNQAPSSDLRTNSDAQRLQALLRGERRLGDGGRIALTLVHLDGDKGAPSEGHRDPADPTQTVRYWRYPLWQNSMAILAASQPFGQGHEVRATLWVQRFAQTIAAYRTMDYVEPLKSRQQDNDLTWGGRMAIDQRLGPGSLKWSVNALQSTHDQQDVDIAKDGTETVKTPQEFRQIVYSAGSEYVLQSGAWTLRAGGALDGVKMTDIDAFAAKQAAPHFQAWSALVGAHYALDSHWSLRLSGGRKNRFPTMRELYGVALGKFLPNPALRPESSLLTEAGVGWQSGKAAAELTLFYNRTADTIDQAQVVDPVDGVKRQQRVNLDGSQTLGVEMAARLRPWRQLEINGHATAMRIRAYDPTTQGYDRFLNRRPNLLSTVTVGWLPATGLSATVQGIVTGTAWSVDSANQQQAIDPSLVLNVRLAWQAALGPMAGEIFARVDNVTDALVLPTLGLPEPGRTLWAGVKAAF